MKKFSLLFLIIGIGALVVIMQKVILPLAYDVVKSDAFLVDSKDQASQLPISNSMTDIAFAECNKHIKEEQGSDSNITFASSPIHSWTLGNYQYIINAEYTITDAASSNTKKYVCRITYENGDNQEGVHDSENWSIDGIDGI